MTGGPSNRNESWLNRCSFSSNFGTDIAPSKRSDVAMLHRSARTVKQMEGCGGAVHFWGKTCPQGLQGMTSRSDSVGDRARTGARRKTHSEAGRGHARLTRTALTQTTASSQYSSGSHSAVQPVRLRQVTCQKRRPCSSSTTGPAVIVAISPGGKKADTATSEVARLAGEDVRHLPAPFRLASGHLFGPEAEGVQRRVGRECFHANSDTLAT